MQDLRLQGTWRSDARRTAREIDAWNDIPAQRKSKLKKLFGKLQLRFTRTLCHTTLNGSTWARRYKVVAKDRVSLAILIVDQTERDPMISHIHFEGTRFWIKIGNGKLREFFRRVA